MEKLVPALICLLALLYPLPSVAKEKLAVMDLKAKYGVDKGLAAALSDIIRDRIHGHGDYEVLSKSDIDAIAERTEIVQGFGCDDTKCLIDIGQELATRFMVAGSISRIGGTYALHLRMLETAGDDPGVRKRVNQNCACQENELIETAIVLADVLMGKKEVGASSASPPTTTARVSTSSPPTTENKTSKVGENRSDPTSGMEFVWVPGGCYEMGCGSWTSDCHGDEKPIHEVCVDGFWMAKNEVTQGQWKQIMGKNPSSFKNGDDFPVETVSWYQVKEYLKKLNAGSSGVHYRLPTEAEWEYACRNGGKKVKYPWGGGLGRNQANCAGCGSQWDRNSTSPAASFSPNDLGLYDMAGNLWEWCEDVYDNNGYAKHSRDNPLATGGGPNRVGRGGAWGYGPIDARCARRGWSDPALGFNYLGFRLVKEP